MASYDLLGNIVVIKFDKESRKEKKKIAEEILAEHKSVSSVLEKAGKVKGRLRKIKTNWLAGEKTKTARYKESGCLFEFDVDETYFSPRLSGERLDVAKQIKKKDKVLVLFAGVAPFSVVIAKFSNCLKVVSVELNRKASKYAEKNVKLNKLNNVEIIQADVKKLGKKLDEKFEVIVMPRPQLKDTFLEDIWKFCKKTRIYYYGFAKQPNEILKTIYEESKKAGKKIKILKVKKAGEIAPHKFRWRVDLRVIS